MIRPRASEPQAMYFAAAGGVPNHPDFPVLLYRRVFDPDGDLAGAFEALFADHHWPPRWRDGVYPYHHFHATAHEAFGIARGRARLLLGGEHGRALDVGVGDALVLPAGTGHCGLSASDDFLAVGAYPCDAVVDMQRADGGTPAAQLPAILAVRMPEADPVGGPQGALMRLWQQAENGRNKS